MDNRRLTHAEANALAHQLVTTGIHSRRDRWPSIAYSAELISHTISATLQSTDRRHGIVDQERCHFQLDS